MSKTTTSTKSGKTRAAALQVISDDDQDVEMGKQLTILYDKAVGGMQNVVICGAMMMMLRERFPEMKEAHRKKLSTADSSAPMTLQKWLDTYAPTVKRTTALRFLAVTESVAEEYATIVGGKVAKQFSLPALVTTPAGELPKAAADKQLTLFDFVSGTSQRSWLDRFVEAKSGGGNNRTTPTVQKPKTPEELAKDAKNEIHAILSNLDAWFLAAHHTRVPKDTRDTTDAVLEEARKKIKAVK